MLSLNLFLVALLATHAIALSPNNLPVSRPNQTWYHPPDHPVHRLFRRTQDDGPVVYAPVGSPQWSAGFPPPLAVPDTSTLPVEWVNALNAAVAAGKIPNVPLSNITGPGTLPVYPSGVIPTSEEICSGSYGCRIPGDIWDGPNGYFACAFDDGPTQATPTLISFLQQKNVIATHFMIGSNILINPNQFLVAYNAGHDISQHTHSHPYMTTLQNLQIVGEMGWTLELIANSTGGRIPKYWRPPYGDTDLRVSAIAREVFSLTTVVWNGDTRDWAASNISEIENSLKPFLLGSKNPGLIILEHELTSITVGGFITSFPLIGQYNWKIGSLAQLLGGGFSYLNAKNSTSDDVTPEPIVSFVSSNSSSITTSPSITAEISTTNTTTTPILNASSGTRYPSTTLTLFLMTLFSLAIVLCSWI